MDLSTPVAVLDSGKVRDLAVSVDEGFEALLAVRPLWLHGVPLPQTLSTDQDVWRKLSEQVMGFYPGSGWADDPGWVRSPLATMD